MKTKRKTGSKLQEPSMYGIYRRRNNYLTGNPDCWVWSVRIHRQGRMICNRTFSDLKHGGAQEALRAAKAFRDEVIRSVEPMTLRERNQMLRRNNASGVPGVYWSANRGYPCYVAETMLPGGKRVRKRFSIKLRGEDCARELAIAERERQLQEVKGRLIFSPGAVVD